MKKKSKIVLTGSVKHLKGTDIQTKSMLGRTYSVMPAVIMVEGSYCPAVEDKCERTTIYFDGDDLEASVRTWNGKPVSINHPNGQETCNCPETYDKQWVGNVFNVTYDPSSKSLKADLWIDTDRGSFIADRVINGDQIDVSIGAIGELLPSTKLSGDYDFKMTNIVGDHLAILPDGTGACNWEDGCGIRAAVYARKNDYDKEKNSVVSKMEITANKEILKSENGEGEQANIFAQVKDKSLLKEKFKSEVKSKQMSECTDTVIEKTDVAATEIKDEDFDIDKWLARAPKKARTYILSAIKADEINRKNCIKKIVSCGSVKFCPDELCKIEDLSLLQSISTLVDKYETKSQEKKVVKAELMNSNYQLNASIESNNSNELDYLPIPAIDWNKKYKENFGIKN